MVTDKDVTFHYKNYADTGTTKEMTVYGAEFIRLFLQYVLPKGFTRVRFAGFLNNARRKKKLMLIHRLLNTPMNPDCLYGVSVTELLQKLYHSDICICEKCGSKMKYYPREKPRPAYIDRIAERCLA